MADLTIDDDIGYELLNRAVTAGMSISEYLRDTITRVDESDDPGYCDEILYLSAYAKQLKLDASNPTHMTMIIDAAEECGLMDFATSSNVADAPNPKLKEAIELFPDEYLEWMAGPYDTPVLNHNPGYLGNPVVWHCPKPPKTNLEACQHEVCLYPDGLFGGNDDETPRHDAVSDKKIEMKKLLEDFVLYGPQDDEPLTDCCCPSDPGQCVGCQGDDFEPTDNLRELLTEPSPFDETVDDLALLTTRVRALEQSVDRSHKHTANELQAIENWIGNHDDDLNAHDTRDRLIQHDKAFQSQGNRLREVEDRVRNIDRYIDAQVEQIEVDLSDLQKQFNDLVTKHDKDHTTRSHAPDILTLSSINKKLDDFIMKYGGDRNVDSAWDREIAEFRSSTGTDLIRLRDDLADIQRRMKNAEKEISSIIADQQGPIDCGVCHNRGIITESDGRNFGYRIISDRCHACGRGHIAMNDTSELLNGSKHLNYTVSWNPEHPVFDSSSEDESTITWGDDAEELAPLEKVEFDLQG